ncbi:gluconokinase [Streptomyces sp. NBC_00637]|uniref:gluconokinase n=1 Tax=Streptomyces sp. NBC_00637 TaxID=2903667 RepID=UPI0032506925
MTGGGEPGRGGPGRGEPGREARPGAPIVLVFGVSGSGKSTVGRAVAERLGVTFVEGDGFHSAANIAKMTAGHALSDADREPWLRALADRVRLSAEAGEGLVVACSALKRAYRDELRAVADGRLWCLCLALDRETARDRVSRRAGHFMPARLVDSQFATLEPLEPDEPGLTLDATAGPPAAVARVRTALDSFGRATGR